MGRSAELQQQIATTLRTRVPEVEVLLAELPSPGLLRVTIDRPDGTVDLDLCQRVSRELPPLRERLAL
jgi:ribosome maturation factor RimP